jgi:ribokinase
VGAPTGVASILVDRQAENLIAVASGANERVDRDLVRRAFATLDRGAAVVLASLEVALDAVLGAARIARDRGWWFVLNPAPARALPPELVAACDVITPNQHEATVMGTAEVLLAAGAKAVVVTLGARGAEVSESGGERRRIPAPNVDAVDTTGAGDAFSGTLAWALASGASLDEAVRAAVAAGALATTRPGARAGMATREELESFLARRVGTDGTTAGPG